MNQNDLENILNPENMRNAWVKIKAKNSQYGIDLVSIQDFEKNYSIYQDEIIDQVKNSSYYPEPYKRIFIEKKNGEFRPISILTVKDKLLQTAVANFYTQKFNKIFTDSNYAYRPNKGHTKAIRRVNDFISRKHIFFAHLDIDNFFDSINRKILLEKLTKLIEEEEILNLFKMWIEIGVIYKGKYINSEIGIAQGGVISPWLSNVYLNDFDKELIARNYSYVRYSDNILLNGKNDEKVKEAFEFAKKYLKDELHLKINKKDKFIKEYSVGFNFLGIHFQNGKLSMAKEKLRKKKEKIKNLIRNTKTEDIAEKLRPSIEGIKRYYLPFDTEEQLLELSQTIVLELSAKAVAENISKNTINSLLYKLNLAGIVQSKKNAYFVNLFKQTINLSRQQEENTKSLRRKLEFRSRKYVKIWYENLDLIVSTSYSTIGKSQNMIVIRNKGKILNEVSVSKINNIIIAGKGITISSNAVALAAEKKIRIDYLDSIGKPYAAIIPAQTPLSKVAIEQLKAINDFTSQIVIKNILLAKLKNQASLLKYFFKSRRESLIIDEWEKIAIEMDGIIEKVRNAEFEEEIDKFRDKLLGYEGSFGASYWRLFGMLLPDFYEFTHREHQKAQNPVNIMLNYGYGILYSRILTAITLAGLNPQIGFLHRARRNKPALVFDLIEPFRAPVVDRTVLALLSKTKRIKITQQNFQETIKSLLLKKVLSRLNSDFYYRKKLVNLNKLILQEAEDLKKFLMKESKTFKPYLLKW